MSHRAVNADIAPQSRVPAPAPASRGHAEPIFAGYGDAFELRSPQTVLAGLPRRALEYIDPSGYRVAVDPRLDGLRVLGIPDTSGKNGQVAFRQLIKNPDRQARANVSVAYLLVIDRPVSAVHILAAMGHTEALKELAGVNPTHFHAKDAYGRTPLYLAARSGFVDLCTYLIRTQRCDVNAPQGDGSTPLHGACFFLQIPVIELLLEAGANPNWKNNYGATPADDIDGERTRARLFQDASHSLAKLKQDCVKTKVVGPFVDLKPRGVEVGVLAKRTCSADVERVIKGYDLAFHGTKPEHVASILQNGLRASGTTLPDGTGIKPPEGHYDMDLEFEGIKGWAKAVFLSPSVTYAAHPAYAKTVQDAANARHRVIIVCRVKPGTYRTFSSTVAAGSYTPMRGAPGDREEFRVAPAAAPPRAVEDVMPGETPTGEIIRVDLDSNVIVVGLLLLRQSFVDNLPPWMTLDEFKNVLDL